MYSQNNYLSTICTVHQTNYENVRILKVLKNIHTKCLKDDFHTGAGCVAFLCTEARSFRDVIDDRFLEVDEGWMASSSSDSSD
jgi:hypothetical protein